MRLALVVAVLVFATAASAAGASFTARGSANQVYVTGLTPGAKAALLDRRGRTVARQRANSLGGLLFRDVKPGSGYRVRSGAEKSGRLTVLSTRAAPPSTDVYDQQIPSSGYGYLTTRDGTRLAYDVHPPQDVTTVSGLPIPKLPDTRPPHGPPPPPGRPPRVGPADPQAARHGAHADADRVLGLRLCQPGGPDERDRDPREPHGLPRRRRQHARHGLLGRRVRLLRAA